MQEMAQKQQKSTPTIPKWTEMRGKKEPTEEKRNMTAATLICAIQ